MGKSSDRKHSFRIRVLAMMVLACAWVFPLGSGMAEASANQVKVSLSVVDSVGVRFGTAAIKHATRNKGVEVIKQTVAETGHGDTQGDIIVTVVDL